MRRNLCLAVVLGCLTIPGPGRAQSIDTSTPVKSFDQGRQDRGSGQWRALDLFGGLIYDVAQSPANASVVLAGTDGSLTGFAIYRSIDGGETWNPVPGPNEATVSFSFSSTGTVFAASSSGLWRSDNHGADFYAVPVGGFQFNAVAVDPSNNSTVWLTRGAAPWVQKSTDGGKEWATANPPNNASACDSIAIDPSDSDRVLVACQTELWLTTDGGQTWVGRASDLGTFEVKDVEFAAGRMLVANFGLVYGSTDGGQTWNVVFGPNDVQRLTHVEDLAIHPNDPSVMLVAEINGGLHYTTDGGETWQISIGGSSEQSFLSVRFAPDQSNRIYAGATITGVHRSLDNGQTLTESSHGIRQLNVVDLAINGENPNELAAAFVGIDNGGIYTSLDGGQTWQREALPFSRWWNVQFAHGRLHAITNGPESIAPAGVYRRDADGTWVAIGTDLSLRTGRGFFGDLEVAAHDPDLILFSGPKSGFVEPFIWRTSDGGASWSEVYQGPAGMVEISEIEIVPNGTDQIMLATLNGNPGTVIRSTDAGATWQESRAGIVPQALPYSVCASPQSPQNIFLIDNGFYTGINGIYGSTDMGQTWTLQPNPPDNGLGGIWRIACDPDQDGVVYAMESFRNVVERSTDHGQTFSDFSQGERPAGFYFEMIAVDSKLYASSQTGVYVRDLGHTLFADGFESGNTGAWN